MDAAVSVKEVGPSATAVVRACTTWTEFPSVWGPMLDAVWAFLRGGDVPEGLYQRGHNVMLYRDDVPNVEIGVQVSGSFRPVGAVVPSNLPAGRVATTVHRGPVGQIAATHSAVTEWAQANGHPVSRTRWEVYGDPDPNTGEFEVEVCWLLSE